MSTGELSCDFFFSLCCALRCLMSIICRGFATHAFEFFHSKPRDSDTGPTVLATLFRLWIGFWDFVFLFFYLLEFFCLAV